MEIGKSFIVRVIIRPDYIRVRFVRAIDRRDAIRDTLDLYSLTPAQCVSVSAHKR